MSKQNPDHYQLGTIQPWDYIVSQDMDYLTGNIVKYITRAGTKPGESKMDDLLKAQAYLTKLIQSTNDITPRLNGSSDPVQDSDVAADSYHEWPSAHDAAIFDR